MCDLLKKAFCSFTAIAIIIVIGANVESTEINMKDKGILSVRTKRLEVVFQDGMIVSVKNIVTGEMHSDSLLADYNIPYGMGSISGCSDKAAKLHVPWGEKKLNQAIIQNTFPSMRHPYPSSEIIKEETSSSSGRIKWRGLTNGKDFFPDDYIMIDAWEDKESGALLLRGEAFSADSGVYGLNVPLVNLKPYHDFYIPSWGGMKYDAENAPCLTTLEPGIYLDAPAIAIEGEKGSLALWIEDKEFHPYFLFHNWSGKSFSIALESLNLMPFEEHKTHNSITWRIDTFNAGWTNALAPYKNWYAKTFTREMEIRESVKWADKIEVIIDQFTKSPEVYRLVSQYFAPETVLFHDWDARTAKFDTELPDWTPKQEYLLQVTELHKYGFRVQGYVNSHCVNYYSQAFNRYKIGEFALPRSISSFFNYNAPRETFENVKMENRKGLMYLDPLSPGWRDFHVRQMIDWCTKTGTDANYEDTGGLRGDYGNGVVDGLFGAQGEVALFRKLLEENPNVPMSAEFGPDAIAFGIKWPLRFLQVWGNQQTKEQWMSRMCPISAYLFGYRSWLPAIKSDSNFLSHLTSACSDALGGVASFAATEDNLLANKGIVAHLRERAVLFSQKHLRPIFPLEKYENNLVCLYQDNNGCLYKYYVDKQIQKMQGPEGNDVYARITGVNAFKTSLSLPGWPANIKGGVIGLDPRERYALTDGAPCPVDVNVVTLPDGVRISRYYETDDFTLLTLNSIIPSANLKGDVTLQANRKFAKLMMNGFRTDIPESGTIKIAGRFPTSFIFLKKDCSPMKNNGFLSINGLEGRFVTSSGLERGKYFPKIFKQIHIPGEEKVDTVYLNNGGDSEVTLDFLIKIPESKSSLLVYFYNTTNSKSGDGTINKLYINGHLVCSFDCAKPQKNNAKAFDWDTAIHKWEIPLDKFRGNELLISLSTDAKTSNNADSLYWSTPKIITDGTGGGIKSSVLKNNVFEPENGMFKTELNDQSAVFFN